MSAPQLLPTRNGNTRTWRAEQSIEQSIQCNTGQSAPLNIFIRSAGMAAPNPPPFEPPGLGSGEASSVRFIEELAHLSKLTKLDLSSAF